MALETVEGNVGITSQLQLLFDGVSAVRATTSQNLNVNTSYGSGDDQLNLIYYKKLTIASSSSTTLDLTDTTLEDPEGNGLVFSSIRKMDIVVRSTDNADWDSTVTLSGNFLTGNNLGTESFGRNGGKSSIDMRSGFTVTASTQDEITITNDDGTEDVDVIVFLGGI